MERTNGEICFLTENNKSRYSPCWPALLFAKPVITQKLENQISAARHEHSTLQLTKHGAQAELADLIRSQKELELRIADLRAADARAGGQRSSLEGELVEIEAQILQKETALAALLP